VDIRFVSIQYPPGYLNWLVFCKQLKYRIDGKRRKIESCLQAIKNACKISMPIDLKQAYEEYHDGCFDSRQLIS
jgi:hypothetical protein